MASMNNLPPDVPRNEGAPEENGAIHDDIRSTVGSVRAKASDLAGKATETVRDGYSRAKDAIAETDPAEFARESGEAVRDAAVRYPLAAFGLGALSVGLIAWAGLRRSPAARYEPDYGRWRQLLQGYGNEAAEAGQNALASGEKWLRSNGGAAREQARDYASQARDYAGYGGKMIARRAEREPIAALLGVGIAVYVIGSLLSSATAKEPAPARRRGGKR